MYVPQPQRSPVQPPLSCQLTVNDHVARPEYRMGLIEQPFGTSLRHTGGETCGSRVMVFGESGKLGGRPLMFAEPSTKEGSASAARQCSTDEISTSPWLAHVPECTSWYRDGGPGGDRTSGGGGGEWGGAWLRRLVCTSAVFSSTS